tara:strand:+ start:12748 stop:13458 length:711 start_codon:yes stop_codon:yes gene_type:complete
MDKELQQKYLNEIGIVVWQERNFENLGNLDRPQISPKDSINRKELLNKNNNQDLLDLQEQVKTCKECALHQSRTQTVFGVGNTQSDWFIIGEAPGSEEDVKGEPFVGRAGQLLNSMLLAMGLPRNEIFIANILKCRPPNNRDPKTDEVDACRKYLKRQLELIKPKIILALGRIAAQNLLKSDIPIGKMRGNSYLYPNSNLPVVVTYHPAYLLRSPREKRKVWGDLKFAMQKYKELT